MIKNYTNVDYSVLKIHLGKVFANIIIPKAN